MGVIKSDNTFLTVNPVVPMDKNSTLVTQNSQTTSKSGDSVALPAKKTIAFIKQFARVYCPVNTTVREEAAVMLN